MAFIRAENEEDYEEVHRVIEMAFGQSDEARLVAALRKVAHPNISLVALEGERVVGHIFFSPVTVESDRNVFTAMGLAPMAVLPEYQNRGVGSLLVWEGLRECLMIGHNVVVVLGHSGYYPRFGFTTARLKGLACEYDVEDSHFMVAELEPGALKGRQGLVKYHPVFNNF
jgi:putative acetyltransferase